MVTGLPITAPVASSRRAVTVDVSSSSSYSTMTSASASRTISVLVQKSDARKIYHQQIGDELWSAIQITTAAGVCAVLDLHVAGRLPRRGLVRQEDVPFDEFLSNRFGEYYQSQMATRYSSGVVGEEQ